MGRDVWGAVRRAPGTLFRMIKAGKAMTEAARAAEGGVVGVRGPFGVHVLRELSMVVHNEKHEAAMSGGRVEQGRRQVEPRHRCAHARGRDRNDTGAGADVEHCLAGLDLCEFDEMCRNGCGVGSRRRKRRPHFALARLQVCERINGRRHGATPPFGTVCNFKFDISREQTETGG